MYNNKEILLNTFTKPSRRLAFMLRVIFYAYPFALLGLWLLFNPTETDNWMNAKLIGSVIDVNRIAELRTWQRVACFGASMLTGGVTMYVLHSLHRLFRTYSQGIIFGPETVACYRAIGYGLIIQQLLSLPEQALQSLILSWYNPAGQRFIALGADEADISLVVVGIMVIIISRIMDEGRKIQEEQQYTI